MKNRLNEQEKFWKGNFGDNYISRNSNKNIINSNVHHFSKIKNYLSKTNSVIEFGSNIGLNLLALKKINKKMELNAVEINKEAAQILNKNNFVKVYEESILNFNINKKFDLTFIKGVLIHINPNELKKVYQKLYTFSKKYIYIAEYYNPTPVSINYRGYKNKLFKRDFVGEFLDIYKDVKLVEYGFAYHKDKFPQDDLNWYLLKR